MSECNLLVMNKINSMDIDEKTKNALINIFESEVSHGNMSDVKKIKIKNAREIILKAIQ